MNQSFAIYRSSIGYILIEHRGLLLSRLQIQRDEPVDFGDADDFTDSIFGQIEEYLEGRRLHFDVEFDFSGRTPFQIEVYKELCRIPYGQCRSYKQIAEAISRPKASRAVGGANNSNPIHIIVPCHRVVGSAGALTGYAVGVDIKSKLLEIESSEALKID